MTSLAHGEQLDCETMWCPSATLSVWANAWLAGKAAPDDVLDALSCWAPIHSVTAYDAVAAGHTGLPWPDVHDAGAVSLLQTLRTGAARPATRAPSITVVLPVPGDVRGLAPGTQFERDALIAGEAVIVANPDDPGMAVGLVPEFGYDDSDDEHVVPELCALSWTVYSLPGAPVLDHTELGDAEYALRLAVRSAADALTTIGLGLHRRRHRRSARACRATAGIRAATPTSRACAVACPACAGKRRTCRRDHHGQHGADSDRNAVAVGGPDCHRRAASVGCGGPVSESGCAQRDSARRLARLAADQSVGSSATQCGGRHGSPLMLAAQPGTGSAPVTRAGARP